MTDNLTLNDYIDAAEERIAKLYNLPRVTDRELARRMALSQASVSAWRRGKAYPDDEAMRRLAEMADLPVEAALAWVSAWRNKGLPVEAVFENMARRLGRTAAAIFCAGFIGTAAAALGPAPARAAPPANLAEGTLAAQIHIAPGHLYITENLRKLRRRANALIGRILCQLAMRLSQIAHAFRVPAFRSRVTSFRWCVQLRFRGLCAQSPGWNETYFTWGGIHV